MTVAIGSMRHKATVKMAPVTSDIDNPPSAEIVVIDNYYVSIRTIGNSNQEILGGSPNVVTYMIVGHYTDKITPGCKLYAKNLCYDITSVFDAEGDMSKLTMHAKQASNG